MTEIRVKCNQQIVKEMLQDRGFTITNILPEENQIHTYNENGDCLIVFFVEGKLNIEIIREFVDLLKENEIANGIIICTDDITPRGKITIDMINNIGEIKLEVFNVLDFVCNKTKHRLVPKHEKLSRDQAEGIVHKYSKIPEMLITDPISRYYGYSKGDVIKITRSDGGVSYRLVI